MSQNLENEYKAMMQEDLPDLWDRISNALPEKNNISSAESVSPAESKTVKKESGRIIRIKPLYLAAAACACVVLLLPVILGNSTMHQADVPQEMASEAESTEEYGAVSDMASAQADSDMASVQAEESAEPLYAADEDQSLTLEDVRVLIISYDSTTGICHAAVAKDAPGGQLKAGDVISLKADGDTEDYLSDESSLSKGIVTLNLSPLNETDEYPVFQILEIKP